MSSKSSKIAKKIQPPVVRFSSVDYVLAGKGEEPNESFHLCDVTVIQYDGPLCHIATEAAFHTFRVADLVRMDMVNKVQEPDTK